MKTLIFIFGLFFAFKSVNSQGFQLTNCLKCEDNKCQPNEDDFTDECLSDYIDPVCMIVELKGPDVYTLLKGGCMPFSAAKQLSKQLGVTVTERNECKIVENKGAKVTNCICNNQNDCNSEALLSEENASKVKYDEQKIIDGVKEYREWEKEYREQNIEGGSNLIHAPMIGIIILYIVTRIIN